MCRIATIATFEAKAPRPMLLCITLVISKAIAVFEFSLIFSFQQRILFPYLSYFISCNILIGG
jgi:hypothetical protein